MCKYYLLSPLSAAQINLLSCIWFLLCHIYLKIFITFILFMFIMFIYTYVGVRGHLSEVCSFLLPCRFWESSVSHQAWWQAFLLTELSPFSHYIDIIIYIIIYNNMYIETALYITQGSLVLPNKSRITSNFQSSYCHL